MRLVIKLLVASFVTLCGVGFNALIFSVKRPMKNAKLEKEAREKNHIIIAELYSSRVHPTEHNSAQYRYTGYYKFVYGGEEFTVSSFYDHFPPKQVELLYVDDPKEATFAVNLAKNDKSMVKTALIWFAIGLLIAGRF